MYDTCVNNIGAMSEYMYLLDNLNLRLHQILKFCVTYLSMMRGLNWNLNKNEEITKTWKYIYTGQDDTNRYENRGRASEDNVAIHMIIYTFTIYAGDSLPCSSLSHANWSENTKCFLDLSTLTSLMMRWNSLVIELKSKTHTWLVRNETNVKT